MNDQLLNQLCGQPGQVVETIITSIQADFTVN
jgi:hypothetical protein